jgi:hypothetical protein
MRLASQLCPLKHSLSLCVRKSASAIPPHNELPLRQYLLICAFLRCYNFARWPNPSKKPVPPIDSHNIESELVLVHNRRRGNNQLQHIRSIRLLRKNRSPQTVFWLVWRICSKRHLSLFFRISAKQPSQFPNLWTVRCCLISVPNRKHHVHSGVVRVNCC